MPDSIQELFLSPHPGATENFKRKISTAAQALADSFQVKGQAFSGLTPQELQSLLQDDELLPSAGAGSESVMQFIRDSLLPNSLKVSSTSYMAHLHSAPLIDNLAAELILSTLNQSMDSWDQAPMATEMEVHVIKGLCRLYKLPSASDGIFTSGGSQSNLMGLFLARDWYCLTKLGHDVRTSGLPEQFNRLRIYTSSVSHFSVEKSAHLMGMGFHSVRPVPVDDQMRMSPSALEALIAEDIAQCNIPMAVVATVGTTDFGSIDPLNSIRKICDQHGMWMHADAAYGSGLVLSDKYSERIKGLETCDSITVDFHKMFMLSISCGAFLLKDNSHFKLLELHADYLNREEDEEEGYVHLVGKSLQTTRRFDALKVWMSFKILGRETLGGLIDRSVETCRASYDSLTRDKRFEVVTKPEISSLVFRYIGSLEAESEREAVNIRIRKTLLHEKGIVIGQTKVKSRTFLKLTLLNPLIEPLMIKELFETIELIALAK